MEYAVRLVQRAIELGVTYLDTARGYRDAEIKMGAALEGQRDKAVISTKTSGKTHEDAWRHINESLERLRTDHVENCHLHGLGSSEDLDQRLGPGGALEALVEAKRQGLIKHIGCTSHRAETIIEALGRYDFEVILVPMNIVEREPLQAMIPLCQERGVGVTIMKPVATGLLPATLALKWLLNQPIACAVPGATTIEELEENVAVGHADTALSDVDRSRVEELYQELAHRRCRICGECRPCPVDINIPAVLGTDVMYDHYRTMGAEGFRRFQWSREAVERDMVGREKTIAAIRDCTNCGVCEERCRYGLPIMDMLPSMLPAMEDMMGIYGDVLTEPQSLTASV